MVLDRESSIPIYRQIADSISEMIKVDNMQKGDRLPTEQEFTTKYDVSRATVRKAIAELVEKNIVNVSPGKGTFVKNPVIQMDFHELRGIYEILALQGLKTDTKLIGYNHVKPSKKILQDLNFPKKTIYSIERLFYVDMQPLAFSTVYFPSEIKFTKEDIEEKKVYELMQDELKMTLDRAEYTIKVSHADEYLNKLLKSGSSSPFLKMERTTFCTDNKPREVTVAYFCADKYEFSFNITNSGEFNI